VTQSTVTYSSGAEHGAAGYGSAIGGRLPWLPSPAMIGTKLMELRKRRVLLAFIVAFTVAVPVIFYGLRLIYHLADSKAYGPAGSPAIYPDVCSLMNEFGFIVAVTLGATAATTDLADGMFRHLVITGRSRVALYLARIPAGLTIILVLMGAGFTIVCLVTSFLGAPSSAAVHENGVSIPAYLSQAQLHGWLLSHPQQANAAFFGNAPQSLAADRSAVSQQIGSLYGNYLAAEATSVNPSVSAMTESGLWIELDMLIGFIVGLGLGSLMGQRTVPIVLMTFLEILITPALATHVLPHFINVQRLLVGVAMDQLQPAALAGGVTFRPGGGLSGGPPGNHPALGIPPMPTWAMITVITGWIVGWSAIGAWRMATRDA
jgi:hypothetical protein